MRLCTRHSHVAKAAVVLAVPALQSKGSCWNIKIAVPAQCYPPLTRRIGLAFCPEYCCCILDRKAATVLPLKLAQKNVSQCIPVCHTRLQGLGRHAGWQRAAALCQRSLVSASMNPVCRMISLRKRTASKPDSLRPLPWVTDPCTHTHTDKVPRKLKLLAMLCLPELGSSQHCLEASWSQTVTGRLPVPGDDYGTAALLS